MKKIHILLLTHSYTPENTAPQRRWDTFVRELTLNNFTVTVVAPQPESDAGNWITEQGPHGETILRIPSPQTGQSRTKRLLNNIFAALSMLPRVSGTKDFDVVIATVPALTTAWAGLAISMWKRKPLILEMRDAWPDLAVDADLNVPLARTTMEKVLISAQRRASQIITVTQGFKERFHERGFKNVTFIPNGAGSGPLNVPAHPGELRTGRLEVVYLGNHGESQGLEKLIHAAALIPDKVNLTFWGSGTQKKYLADLARAVNAPVEFLDPVQEECLTKAYEKADTCVVSLRPDWKSFEWTIPSKTYELLLSRRKLTAILKGEAAALVTEYQPNSIVSSDAEAIAHYWENLYHNPEELVVEDHPSDPEYLVQERHVPLLMETIRSTVTTSHR